MGRRATATKPDSRRYTSAIMGDGSILPIQELIGRRLLREIDPLCIEGRQLLIDGRVSLHAANGTPIRQRRIDEILDRLLTLTRHRREAYPQFDSWTRHHDRMLESIHRMKRLMTSRP